MLWTLLKILVIARIIYTTSRQMRKCFTKIIFDVVLLILLALPSNALLIEELPYGSDNMQGIPNTTVDNILTKPNLCLIYPQEAETEMKDTDYKTTLAALFETKGFPQGSVSFFPFAKVEDIIALLDNQCGYNIVIIKDGTNDEEKIEQLVEFILHNWRCVLMEANLYYYTQQSESELWIGMGTDCDVSVCPVTPQGLGIGCNAAVTSTYEPINNDTTVALLNVVDDVRHRVEWNSATCNLKSCKKGEPRFNTAVLRVSKLAAFDTSTSPVNMGSDARLYRVNIGKWWKIFYTIVDFVNQFIQSMSAAKSFTTYDNWIFK
ncbi:VP7 [Rotavirus K]|nr:VP7 [Rotavirus K]